MTTDKKFILIWLQGPVHQRKGLAFVCFLFLVEITSAWFSSLEEKNAVSADGFRLGTGCERGEWRRLTAAMGFIRGLVSRQILRLPPRLSRGLRGKQQAGARDTGGQGLIPGWGALAQHLPPARTHDPRCWPYTSTATELRATGSQRDNCTEASGEGRWLCFCHRPALPPENIGAGRGVPIRFLGAEFSFLLKSFCEGHVFPKKTRMSALSPNQGW